MRCDRVTTRSSASRIFRAAGLSGRLSSRQTCRQRWQHLKVTLRKREGSWTINYLNGTLQDCSCCPWHGLWEGSSMMWQSIVWLDSTQTRCTRTS